jgi:hypothetical protein
MYDMHRNPSTPETAPRQPSTLDVAQLPPLVPVHVDHEACHDTWTNLPTSVSIEAFWSCDPRVTFWRVAP